MKKILYLLALPLLFQACYFSDEDKFDENATERVNALVEQTKTELNSVTNGWVLQYFPFEDYGGYNYTILFNGQKATVSCEAVANSSSLTISNTDPSYTEECLYDVIAEDGALLTFNTYSELFHQFRNPSASAVDGFGGDYEFRITSVSDTLITLVGKTNRNTMYLFPLPSGYTRQSYLEAVIAMEKKGKQGSFDVVTIDDDKIGTTTGLFNGRVLSITNDETSTTEDYGIVYTPTGFVSCREINVNNFHGKNFVYNEAKRSFVATDGDLAFSIGELQPLNKQFAKAATQWWFDPTVNAASSDFTTQWQSAYAGNVSYLGESLDAMYIGLNHAYPNNDSYQYAMVFASYDGSKYWYACFGINMQAVSGTQDQVSISYLGEGLNVSYYQAFLVVVNYVVTNSPYVLTADDVEEPTKIKLTSINNSNAWFEVSLL